MVWLSSSTLYIWYDRLGLTFSTEVWFERLDLFKVFEQFHVGSALPDSVESRVIAPDKLLGRAETLVTQRHRRIDDVLAVTADCHKPGIRHMSHLSRSLVATSTPLARRSGSDVLPAIRVVCNALRVDLTAAHVFDGQRQPLAILDISVCESLDVCLLYLSVFGPDNLTTTVH